ncbi:Bug family tripartite tricarboxylate transporter substrate binding protein [Roseococcus pinisoli]|uniref:Tripartite tricarboxylate transporter substrate binding protein n=1 Tax=Roseococcus pinisoli TaxID=2835040 RepID=A0ABS5QGB7_9PROT|nr:tripartite tricarboxylate transporter substrate binding protein [Roseococcus pinisoli]MBS7811985.1 tripartite tricarboxylate transporter substrate binding protein [Roseococcus pinisoli]
MDQVARRALMGLGLSACTLPALAQSAVNWPDKPWRVLVGGAPGGASDIFMRILEPYLRENLGPHGFWLDNRPGAGGMLAAEICAQAPADGYNFLVNHIASNGIGPHLHRRPNFEPNRDLTGVARIAAMPNTLIVLPSRGFRNVADLVAYARANPRSATFGSAGVGTSSHLSGVLFGQRAGVEVTHVPYRGTAPNMQAVLAGEILFAIDNAPASAQQVRAGMLTALAVSSAQRWSQFPDVPTIQESGVPDFDVASWYGLAAPSATPRPIVEKLGAAILSALADPATVARLREFGADPWPAGPADYQAFMIAEERKWGPIVRAAGVTIN